jgi:hypothetical protein
MPERKHGAGPQYLVTTWDSSTSQTAGAPDQLSPRIQPERIQARTGFELEIAPDVHETPAPADGLRCAE